MGRGGQEVLCAHIFACVLFTLGVAFGGRVGEDGTAALLPGQMAPVTEGGGGAIKGKKGARRELWSGPSTAQGLACPPGAATSGDHLQPHLLHSLSFAALFFQMGVVAALVAGLCLARHCAHFSVTLVSLLYGRRKRRCRKNERKGEATMV